MSVALLPAGVDGCGESRHPRPRAVTTAHYRVSITARLPGTLRFHLQEAVTTMMSVWALTPGISLGVVTCLYEPTSGGGTRSVCRFQQRLPGQVRCTAGNSVEGSSDLQVTFMVDMQVTATAEEASPASRVSALVQALQQLPFVRDLQGDLVDTPWTGADLS